MARKVDPVGLITPELLAHATPDEKEQLEALLERRLRLEGKSLPPRPWPTDDPMQLLRQVAPQMVWAPLAPHHVEFWRHVMAIEPGVRPRPLAFFVGRGGAKSASAELATILLGGERRRRYCVYVSGTQELADDHVASVSAVLESATLAAAYPKMADRKLGKYGHKAWRRQRLQTALGFTIDAVGLDAATRGRRIEEQRPDWIVFDDVDALNESVLVTLKKLRTITGTIIPMGSPDAGLLFPQNLIHENSIARRVAEPDVFPEREQILRSAKVIGPIPAVENLQTQKVPDPDQPGRTRIKIVGGAATWEGLPLPACEAILNDVGEAEFGREYQHDMTAQPGGIFSHIEWRRLPWDDIPWPKIVDTQVWCDPAVTAVDGSDAQGVQADCVDSDGRIYRLFSFERVTTPTEAIKLALTVAHAVKASAVGVETDQGGDTWLPVFREALRQLVKDELVPRGWSVKFRQRKASGVGSKVERAQEMVRDYEDGWIVHVTGGPFSGSYLTLERALHRFPLTKPLDLVDAAAWSWRAMRALVKVGRLHDSVGSESARSGWHDPADQPPRQPEQEVEAPGSKKLPARLAGGDAGRSRWAGPASEGPAGPTTRSGWSL